MQAVADRLRHLRNSVNLSQVKMAEVVGVKQSSLNRYEQNQASSNYETADRPEFQRMVQDSAKGLFDVVIVWKLDRFSRDRYDSAHYKRILRGNGVKVVSAKENISEGPEGIILEAMLEGYAEYYSAELSQKIHRGLKTKLGKEYNLNSFNRILKNRKYIGEYRYREVVIADGVPAIISLDLFDRVQERMEKNKRAPARSKATDEFLLTTKLFCGQCQRMMGGERGAYRWGVVNDISLTLGKNCHGEHRDDHRQDKSPCQGFFVERFHENPPYNVTKYNFSFFHPGRRGNDLR